MGCVSSKPGATRDDEGAYGAGAGYGYSSAQNVGAWQYSGGGGIVGYKKPNWRSDEPISAEKLKVRAMHGSTLTCLTESPKQQMRAQFWDTQPFYGGAREIWDALKAAVEMEDM
jgi:hypothetical protein